MATYSKSTFGKIRGKVGETVGSKWRGVKYLRSLPDKSGKAPSVKQLAVHAKFALSASRLTPIKELLNIGFGDKKLNKITGYNAAARAFLTEAIIGEYPNFEVDYSKVKMSKGSLDEPDINMELGTEIALTWPDELDSTRAFADDRMVLIIFNETKENYKVREGFTRGDLAFTTPFPGKPGDALHLWSFCIKRDGKTVSNSLYLGTAVVPV